MVPHLKNQLFSASIIKYLYVTEAEVFHYMMHFLKVLPCRFLMFKLMIVLIVSAVSYSAGASLSCQFILRDYLIN